jgi:peptidoglycan/xylan/chitin deacetylase (PgdA/CDA1 family)
MFHVVIGGFRVTFPYGVGEATMHSDIATRTGRPQGIPRPAFRQFLKNLLGWSTRRKLLVLSFDDYGVVRVASREALARARQWGLPVENRFDELDALESRTDIEAMVDTLDCVRDKHNRPAVLSPFFIPMNLDFEAANESGLEDIRLEALDFTYQKLADHSPEAYGGAWDAWQEAVKSGLFVPALHGCQHWSSALFRHYLAHDRSQMERILSLRSYAWLPPSSFANVDPMQGCAFQQAQELDAIHQELERGVREFTRLLGAPPKYFNAPGGNESCRTHEVLARNGIRYIDVPRVMREHLGDGRVRRRFFHTGKRNRAGLTYIVRNVVFEPTFGDGGTAVDQALKQIAAAFRMQRPAVVSSHRVNFGGEIDPNNRRLGLERLGELLRSATRLWPDIEFISADELGGCIAADSRRTSGE